MADSLLSRGHRMDGVHDLGGKQGFGPVRYSSRRAAFKAAWEPRANALYSLGVRLGLIEPTYDVSFRTEDLWPQASDPATVHVGVFESYLERAP